MEGVEAELLFLLQLTQKLEEEIGRLRTELQRPRATGWCAWIRNCSHTVSLMIDTRMVRIVSEAGWLHFFVWEFPCFSTEAEIEIGFQLVRAYETVCSRLAEVCSIYPDYQEQCQSLINRCQGKQKKLNRLLGERTDQILNDHHTATDGDAEDPTGEAP